MPRRNVTRFDCRVRLPVTDIRNEVLHSKRYLGMPFTAHMYSVVFLYGCLQTYKLLRTSYSYMM